MNNKAHFESIYKENYAGLLHFASWYLKEKEDAHEIVQEVFLSIWEREIYLDQKVSLKPYLYTAVKNKALNAIRNEKKNHRNHDGQEHIADPAYNPEERMEFAALKSKIDAAIQSLPDRCKMVFLLKRREGLSHKEVSSLMDISEKTVENQMTKALKQIKEFIEKF